MSPPFQDPIFGTVAPNSDGYWDAEVDFQDRTVEIDLNAENAASLDEAVVRLLTSQVARLDRLDARAREAILDDDSDDEDAALSLYRSLHLEELDDDDLDDALGDDGRWRDDARVFVERLQLVRVGLYPEEPDNAIILDLTISRELTDHLLSVAFDQRGNPTVVSFES